MHNKTFMIATLLAASTGLHNQTAEAALHSGWRHHHQAGLAHAGRWGGHRLDHAGRRHFAYRSHWFRTSRHYATGQVSSPLHSFTASVGAVQTGRASFYAGAGHTASGGFVGSATCAHRSLPFGTKVLVTNTANARQAVLTVNDRGPFVRGRLLDVSRGAAGLLGMLHSGVSQIRMQILGGAG